MIQCITFRRVPVDDPAAYRTRVFARIDQAYDTSGYPPLRHINIYTFHATVVVRFLVSICPADRGCGAPIAPRSRLEPSYTAPPPPPRSNPSGHVPRRPLAASAATMWVALPASCSLAHVGKQPRSSSSESAKLRRARSAASKTCGRTGREHCFRTGRCAGIGQQCSTSFQQCSPHMSLREHAQNGPRSRAAGGACGRSLRAGEARGCIRQAACGSA